jgi:hypothetical protein
MRHEWGAELCGYPPLGTPIYESEPLLSATRCVLEPLATVDACRRLVADEGGEEFFEQQDWLQRLRTAHDRTMVRGLIETQMSVAAFQALVASELRAAVESFERELGRPPRYFAYPWMLGSTESQRLLRDHGMLAAFGVALDFRRTRRAVTPLPVYPRYKADWLRFMPGKGRRRLHHVLPRKLATFVTSQHLAH